jgi:hypothetical protein
MASWARRPGRYRSWIVVKVRDGQVRNKPIYVVRGVTVSGERDILGLWPATATRAPSLGGSRWSPAPPRSGPCKPVAFEVQMQTCRPGWWRALYLPAGAAPDERRERFR